MALNATMRAVLWTGIPFQMNVTDVPIPTIINQTDAIVKVTTAAICGTDLHTYHGVYGSQTAPWIMGHECIGVVDEIGSAVGFVDIGDRVIVPDATYDGHAGFDAFEDVAFGFGVDYGLAGGCQAEYVRVPFADNNLIPIPDTKENNTLDNDYLLVGDIFATAWAGLDFSGFEPGDSVAVFGSGPLGLLAAYSAILRGASTVYAVDHVSERLEMAESIGAIPINFRDSDPVEQIRDYEPKGVSRSVDCIGYEAVNSDLEHQQNIIINNMVSVTAQGGGIGQIGWFTASGNSSGTPRGSTMSPTIDFPISEFFDKGLTMHSGAVDVLPWASTLVELIASGRARPGFIVSSEIGIEEVPKYYERFDQHLETKVMIRFAEDWPVRLYTGNQLVSL